MLSSWKKIPQIKRHAIVGAIICLGMLIYSFFAVDSVLDFMSRTVIMMLFASALNIILGFGGLRPLGMATYFGMGSYAYVILVVRLGWAKPLAIIGAMALAMLISLGVNILCLRANDDLAFAFMSMGINTLLFTMVYKIPYVGSDTGLTGNVRLAFASSSRGNFYLSFGISVVCIVLIYLFYHSPFATVLKGSRDNLERLTFVGMNTQNVRLFACMVSSFFVAVAGILYAMRNMGAFPVMFSTNTSTEGLVMCLIGGMQAFFGPILGAVIVTFISTQVSILTNYYQFILGAIIVFCVLFLQNGLLRDDVTRNLDEPETNKKGDCQKMSEPILKVEHLNRYFGALHATKDVSFEVPEGQVRAIIGPNGAGKSTLMDLITNRTTPSSGKVIFRGEDITGLAPNKIVHKGMTKCFQISKLFNNLTVYENVQIARIEMNKKTFSILPVRDAYLKKEVVTYLQLVGLEDKMNDVAAYLSYGDQRRLDIAIALAMDPKLLILDEPAAGVAREEAYTLMQLIRDLAAKRNMTIIFIEHDMDIVFNYADEISVLRDGELIASGTPDEIKQNEYVQQAYLGGDMS